MRRTTSSIATSLEKVSSGTISNHEINLGAFGEVHKCQNKKTGEIRAVKIIDKSRMTNEDEVRLKYEVDILTNLIHPNIVRLYEVYQSKDAIFLVTELCDGKELFEEITQRKKFTEK